MHLDWGQYPGPPTQVCDIYICQRYEYRIDHLYISHNASWLGPIPGTSNSVA